MKEGGGIAVLGEELGFRVVNVLPQLSINTR